MLPVIDLSVDKEVVKEQIVKGLTTSGVLYLKSHGIGDAIKEEDKQMRSFFNLPEDHPAKEESLPETLLSLCGYFPLKFLSVYKVTGKEGPADACRQFFIQSENNRYPKSLPQFGHSMDKLFKQLLEIGELLLTIIGEAMNIDMEAIKEGFFSGNTTTLLKLIHYPIPTDED